MRDLDDQNSHLRDEIRTVVERQLEQSGLAEVNLAVERLVEQGHSRQRAIDAIGAILLEEMVEVMAEKKPFDQDRYAERVAEL